MMLHNNIITFSRKTFRELKFVLVEGKGTIILWSPNHGRWWPCDTRTQSINSHAMFSRNIPAGICARKGWLTQDNRGIAHVLFIVNSTQRIWLYCVIGIDTDIEVIVVSLTTCEAHHSPRAKPEGCGELPRSLMRQQWPKLRYQFLFYHDETKLMRNKLILSI